MCGAGGVFSMRFSTSTSRGCFESRLSVLIGFSLGMDKNKSIRLLLDDEAIATGEQYLSFWKYCDDLDPRSALIELLEKLSTASAKSLRTLPLESSEKP